MQKLGLSLDFPSCCTDTFSHLIYVPLHLQNIYFVEHQLPLTFEHLSGYPVVGQLPPVLSRRIICRWALLLSLEADCIPRLLLIILSCHLALISDVHGTPCNGLGLGLHVMWRVNTPIKCKALSFILGLLPWPAAPLSDSLPEDGFTLLWFDFPLFVS